MGGVGDDNATGGDPDALRIGCNGDRMVGAGKFHGFGASFSVSRL
jgi:hypothetical protein